MNNLHYLKLYNSTEIYLVLREETNEIYEIICFCITFRVENTLY